MERSRHLSSKGVQAYERTTTKQQQVVCGVLAQKGQTYGGNLAAAETKREPFAEVQPNGEMAESMAAGLQQASQVIKMEGCTVNITMQLKYCENCFSSTHLITYHIFAVFAFNG